MARTISAPEAQFAGVFVHNRTGYIFTRSAIDPRFSTYWTRAGIDSLIRDLQTIAEQLEPPTCPATTS